MDNLVFQIGIAIYLAYSMIEVVSKLKSGEINWKIVAAFGIGVLYGVGWNVDILGVVGLPPARWEWLTIGVNVVLSGFTFATTGGLIHDVGNRVKAKPQDI